MRRPTRIRPAHLAAALAVSLALAACGSSSGAGTTGSSSAATRPGSTQSGKAIFSSAGCAGCHTLAAAGATGNVGPDLDNLKPSEAAVVRQVTDGGGGMPSFKGRLSRAQIEAVARFVSSSTH